MGVHDLILSKANQDSADYALANFSHALMFKSKRELWTFCLEQSTRLSSGTGGNIAEFGVFRGTSINFFAKNCPNAQVHGFDSFEGLEEDWYGFNLRKKTFDLKGKIPKVESNVYLHKGWFEETVPDFVEEFKSVKLDLVHMDADTYKPTKYVLIQIRNLLDKGTIVVFDEYFGYPNFQLHEFRAWKEFSAEFRIKYRYIGYCEQQVAIEIT